MSTNHLVIITGPTSVGKTGMAVEIAKYLGTEIINADSRQVYREMSIGTAIPSLSEQAEVKHHFLAHRSIFESYNASSFEQEVIAFLDEWYKKKRVMVMVGGSGMYIDAVCRGIDDLPSVDPEVRKKTQKLYEESGLEGIKAKLKKVDPVYYDKADLNNPKRIMKALEIVEMSGVPYSSFLTGRSKDRIFSIIKIGLDIERARLHERINNRVEHMMKQGLLQEAISLYSHRHLNALNTVGYKELFAYIEGKCTLEDAIEHIKAHTRQYARRQLTWFRKDEDIHWFDPFNLQEIKNFLKSH
jgi:tRNA dimethylallyltransferase